MKQIGCFFPLVYWSVDEYYLLPEWESLASILLQFFVFINVNAKETCSYK